jgi:adenylyltransferase/sulfurtransferase
MASFDPDRYSRQVRFTPLGHEGQARLAGARVAIVGCGALGSVVAMTLVRAGVGFVRIIDRDVPELSNLPRQVLFDEADVVAGVPKAAAAAAHLRRINSAAQIEPVVADLTPMNAETLLGGVDVIVDGTDNFEARFIVNEYACRHGIPWVYGGAIGAEGRVMTVLPGITACLRCLIPDPPAPGVMPTCDTAGIIGPTAVVVGAIEAAETIKLIVGVTDRLGNRLLACDLWDGVWRTIDLSSLAEQGCATCRAGDFPWLEGRMGTQAAAVTANPWLVRAELEPGILLSVFADGRAIVAGTRDESKARAIVARYVGA